MRGLRSLVVLDWCDSEPLLSSYERVIEGIVSVSAAWAAWFVGGCAVVSYGGFMEEGRGMPRSWELDERFDSKNQHNRHVTTISCVPEDQFLTL